MRDTNDALVAFTLQSLAVLVPLLGAQVVVGGERTKVFKQTTPNFTKSTDVTPENSPVHIVEASLPCSLQPKVTSLLPKRLEEDKLVLEKLPSLRPVRGDCAAHLPSTSETVLDRNIALPLNDLSQEKEGENGIRTDRPDEDWPDWEDAEEKSGKYQAVQISIQSANSESELPTTYDEEGLWDDFEDSELISKHSTTTPPQPDSSKSLIDSAMGPISVPTSRKSKALKLSTASVKTASEQNNVPSDTSWEQNTKDTTPSKPELSTEAKPKNGYRSARAGGLGEEFAIEVKKKPDRDPELDLFADMVPDIKLSFPSMFLHLETSVSKYKGPPATAVSYTEPDTTPLNTLEPTAKFAAVDQTETDAQGWADCEINWEDDSTWP